MRGFNHKKAVQALNFLSKKAGGRLNKLKAIKLIWLADRLHLRKYGRTITGDIYFALPNGPVPSSTRDILEQNSFSLSADELKYSNEFIETTDDKYHYQATNKQDLKVFSQTDLAAINSIFEMYGHLDKYVLRDLSHNFPEWKKYESALNQKLASRFEMDYIDFFENVDDFSGLFIDSPESLEISKEVYSENKKLASIL